MGDLTGFWKCHNLFLSLSVSLADLMSWLKTFTLSLDVICAAVETLYQLGRSKEIKQTQVGDFAFFFLQLPHIQLGFGL